MCKYIKVYIKMFMLLDCLLENKEEGVYVHDGDVNE